eukprot:gb/GECG01008853.1/.p1 GENE.gb/GECG01008853.1/~~gb/GECG01008853.1/.p1  ORF type:complete len:128 (+),score=18.10 gb/GECG01008853.1/:1-384(+)
MAAENEENCLQEDRPENGDEEENITYELVAFGFERRTLGGKHSLTASSGCGMESCILILPTQCPRMDSDVTFAELILLQRKRINGSFAFVPRESLNQSVSMSANPIKENIARFLGSMLVFVTNADAC